MGGGAPLASQMGYCMLPGLLSSIKMGDGGGEGEGVMGEEREGGR